MKKLLCATALLGSCIPAGAVEFSFDGYADLRILAPSDERSWVDGGLGKTRFGDEHNSPDMHVEAAGAMTVELFPELIGTAVMRIEPTQKVFADFLEAYVRYRPISTSAWRFTLKGGAFFPGISLENTDIGWTSPWTLTPSAINSWVGEELRTIGAEATVELRAEGRTISVTAAAYGWNDPAGILLNTRGWGLDDRPTTFADHLKIPDASAIARGLPVPQRTLMFSEIDNKIGWYAGATWDEAGIGKVMVMRYDNEANPEKIRTQVAWETSFWSAGAASQIGNLTILAQGMTGETYIEPSPFFESETYFDAAYLLLGWTMSDAWRLAGRYDIFSTDEEHTGAGAPLSEHGNAYTFAVNYLPNDWLRFTAELLHVDSTRAQRAVTGDAPAQHETQFQLGVRAYLP